MAINEHQTQVHDPFSYLYPYEFMRLTTFRKSGVAVPTTVWFAHDNGKLYITTQSTAGKMKRIRNNARVLLAPCDRMGQNLLGKEIEARAHEVSSDAHEHAIQVLSGKYGAQFDAIMSRISANPQRTFIEVEPGKPGELGE